MYEHKNYNKTEINKNQKYSIKMKVGPSYILPPKSSLFLFPKRAYFISVGPVFPEYSFPKRRSDTC